MFNGKDNLKESKRIEYIDVAKAIGIIVVIFSHGCGFPFGIGYLFTASYMPLFFLALCQIVLLTNL